MLNRLTLSEHKEIFIAYYKWAKIKPRRWKWSESTSSSSSSRGFTFLSDGRIETEKKSDHLLRPKKKTKRILLVSFGTGQVSRILFPWDRKCLHNYSEIAFIASGSCSEAYLPEGCRLVCGSPLAWKYWSCLFWPVLIPNILFYIHVTLCSIPFYFVKAKSSDKDVGGFSIFILLRS